MSQFWISPGRIFWVRCLTSIVLAAALAVTAPWMAVSQELNPGPRESSSTNRQAVGSFEEWSALSLPLGSFAIGSVMEVGLGHGFMIGTDPVALSFGIRTAQVKWQLPFWEDDHWAIGLKYSVFQRSNILNASVREDFDTLGGRFFRPSIAWSNRISGRLTLHTMWASGIGKATAELSSQGRRELWEAKHKDTPFPGETTERATNSTPDPATKEEDAAFAKRVMQAQSLTGLTEDRFQITGVWRRDDGNHVLLSSRFERTRLEELETFSFRVTLAQEWVLDLFHLRIGGGPQYAMFSGKDLDSEKINAAGWMPAADLALFWVF